MTTNFNNSEAFVWTWLPGKTQPIVAGKLERINSHHDFFYGESYLKNPHAISFSKFDLPLIKNQRFESLSEIHPVFRDSLPDAWGQRILYHKYSIANLSLLDMLMLSSSDRIGALHFQNNPTQFQAAYEDHASLEELQEAAQYIEAGKSLPPELGIAIMHGTSIGGARPKATINDKNHKFIAKFSSSTDVFPIVQAEYAAMWLAKKVGLKVAPTKLITVGGKYILLIERFDRVKSKEGWSRKFLKSGLTILELEESEARYASYLTLADQITKQSRDLNTDLHELFNRMVFNILVGNTDDHAKNHAFFWDGEYIDLTPAYDICPYPRIGQEATQAMIVGKMGAFSLLSNALSGANAFNLSQQEAKEKIEKLTHLVKTFWPEACERAELTDLQQKRFTNTAILNPYIFFEYV